MTSSARNLRIDQIRTHVEECDDVMWAMACFTLIHCIVFRNAQESILEHP